MSNGNKYVKKPIVIEAMQFDGTNKSAMAIMGWMVGNGAGRQVRVATRGLTIMTFEGDMLAKPGDWVIRGIKGEFYPCKPDIFEATYYPAALDADSGEE